MKTVILAGGLGTRLAEETSLRPKPMVEIGGRPILWHVMSIYAAHGFDNFVVACGYKGEAIKQYFSEFHFFNSDLLVSLNDGKRTVTRLEEPTERPINWTVHCVDTGLESLTGGRLLRLKRLLQDGTFLCTYGDGLSDVPIREVVDFHRSHGKLATVTAVHPPARFGMLEMAGNRVSRFSEKPQTDRDWINGGFFVFEPGLLDYISGPGASLERDVLERVAADGQLMAYRHDGFFQPMDTLREKQSLEEMWNSGNAPWKAVR
ncbi:MAG: glucose-1-phosphate cytidylyltransferase [Alphaproteobacteria bacterium]|nr:glucose-1-phosphate cytidylyltransferase [Alphaproteobacteria bacterium]